MLWNRRLAYDLPLKDGSTLHTLHDSRDLIAYGVFSGVTVSPPLEHAIKLLLKAAKTGEPDDVRAATDQIAVALRVHGLMA
jgi:hypothetical protein